MMRHAVAVCAVALCLFLPLFLGWPTAKTVWAVIAALALAPVVALLCLCSLVVALGYLRRYREGPATVWVRHADSDTNNALAKACPILEQPWEPTLWGQFGHVQSTCVGFLRQSPQVEWTRMYIEEENGETVTVDWLHVDDKAPRESPRPVIMLIPGIAGGSYTPYIRSMSFFMHRAGYHCCVLNHRGCHAPLTAQRLFTLGGIDETQAVVAHIQKRFPNSPIVGLSWSMGANILCNYIAKTKDCPLVGAMSICQGYDGIRSIKHVAENYPVYDRILTHKLKSLVRLHQRELAKVPNIDIDHVLTSKSLVEFDTRFTCPVNGYSSPQEYYTTGSCLPLLPNVGVPLMLLNTSDDPLVCPSLLPYNVWRENDNIICVITNRGGHCGFAEGGGVLASDASWSDRLCLEFTRALLARAGATSR